MDLQILRVQDDMTQIATNDHHMGWGENGWGKEKSSPVPIAELHTGITLSYESSCIFYPPSCQLCAGGNTFRKTEKKSLPSGKLLWVARAAIRTHRSPDGGGKLKSKNVLLKAECDQPQRRCWGERGLNCALRQLSPLSELDLLIS